MRNKTIFAICSPSGAGKSTFINYLLTNYAEDFQRYPTVTSRSIRDGEAQGNPYYFVSQDEAEELIRSGDYLEYERKPYNNAIYGKTKSVLEKLTEDKYILAEEQMYQVQIFKDALPEYKIYGIYILLENIEQMKKRLLARGDDPDHIEKRIEYALNEEREEKHLADFLVTSYEGDVERTVKEFLDIVKSLS